MHPSLPTSNARDFRKTKSLAQPCVAVPVGASARILVAKSQMQIVIKNLLASVARENFGDIA